MLWQTIDSLISEEFSQRSVELQKQLENFGDQELIEFQREAEPAFRSLFIPSLYYLYSVVYEGEVNGTGLTDFCSNIMIAGSGVYDAVSRNPDELAEVVNLPQFNDEYCTNVGDAGWRVLTERYDVQTVEGMFRRAGVQTLSGIWGDLERRVGKPTFEPDWRIVEETMPRIFAKMRR